MLRRIEITTDYPVLGDSDHSVKTGWAWAWDRDKYVQISIGDQLYWVKCGYIRRKLDGKPLGDYQLAYLPEKVWSNSGKTHTPGTLPTRLQAAREVMADRRRRKTKWELVEYGGDWRITCAGVHDAVSKLRATTGFLLRKMQYYKRGFSFGPVACAEPDGKIVIYTSGHRNQAGISAKQIRRLLRRAP